MPIGDNLSRVDQQYIAKKDDKNTWRILNLWHPELKNLSSGEDDVPDNHPAVTILTEGAFLALVKSAVQEGVIQNAVMSAEVAHDNCVKGKDLDILYDKIGRAEVEINFLTKSVTEKSAAIKLLEDENSLLKQEKPRSEAFETTKLVVDSLVRLAGMSNLKDKDERNKT
ncbi:hypothetical protein HYS94_01840 [Candidatus Daviesbacteria bacterium]|nr:hypothetical protein [Candidatus Daviesbacteria bacterium]